MTGLIEALDHSLLVPLAMPTHHCFLNWLRFLDLHHHARESLHKDVQQNVDT